MNPNIPDIQKSLNRNFDTALNNLKRYKQAPAFFDLRFAQYAEGQHYTKPLERLRIQNSDFRRCRFSAPVIRTNISGSNYITCMFDTADLQHSNFQFGTFENCHLERCCIEGSNFSNSFISVVTLINNRFIV